MIEPITSLDDERLDAYLRLTELQLRNKLEPEKGIFIAESEKVIDRALDGGYEPLSMLVPDHKLGGLSPLIDKVQAAAFEAARKRHTGSEILPHCATEVPVFVAPAEQITKITGYELTRGVLCAMRRPKLPEVEDLLADARRVAILEDITNHTNVGAIFRSAAALGVDAVLVTPGCCDPLYRRAVRVSMGTVFQVPWTRIGSEVGEWPHPDIDRLKALGFKTCALALKDDSVSLDDEALCSEEKLAFIFGTEGDGLCDATIDACDYTVKIPMAHGVDSLNVAAASAVTFWQLRV